MGLSVSSGISAYTPNTGVNSRSVSRNGKNPSTSSEGEILQSRDLKKFDFNELKIATRNFRQDSVIGQGAFGKVFKGWIDEHLLTPIKSSSGVAIAVKRLEQESARGHKEWLTEVIYLGKLRHPNLVKLIGYCCEDDHRLLVYEFMSRGSLNNHLFRRGFEPLSWDIRMKVALGAAKGLAFLHSVDVNVIYRNFNTSDVLLDSNYNPKLSDFGLVRGGPTDDKSHVSTAVRGTSGWHLAPEYVVTGHLSVKSDVYSFGVVLLEMVSGRRAMDNNRPPGQENLVEWAKLYLTNKRRFLSFLDPRLDGQHFLRTAQKLVNLALHCLNSEPKFRPDMDDVVMILERLQESN
ncbi:hypothetical protein JCGZ_09078 [Jatropha curcas]|uniref:non-specific serine/threonine protein kinase n=1 Tax=Jatropha curcas TaxID=180498 RepID=A0A067KTP8_JATCU|nr:receptor-like cytoplasmic kinase 176 [Jatropha curcas]KDP35640.1 hypothetical protein JCGZ_09078 [Jatropha curcas]